MTVGTLIVGLGRIGMGYDLDLDPAAHVYSHARAFSLHPAFRLLGGVDPDGKRRSAFEREYRCPAFPDIDSALDAIQPELTVIAVPTALHGDTLGRILDRSQPKVVLCEKPLSYDLAEATSMLAACADRGARLFVNYMRRSDPGVIEIKRRFDSGEIRQPVKGVAWYSKGLMHNGSHFFNLLAYWLGEMTDARILDPGRLWDGIDPEPDFEVSFKGGKVLFLAAREEDYSHYTIELVAPNGRLRYDGGGRRIEWQGAAPDPRFAGFTTLSRDVEVIHSGMDRFQYNVVDQLASLLGGNEASLSTGEDALRTIDSLTTIISRLCIPL